MNELKHFFMLPKLFWERATYSSFQVSKLDNLSSDSAILEDHLEVPFFARTSYLDDENDPFFYAKLL